MNNFPNLFSPIRIGSLELENRIVMPAMGTGLVGADGSVGERLIRYYRERAAGGAGLIITENLGIHPTGKNNSYMAMIDHDDRLEGLTRLVDEVHRAGGRIAAQLNHAGRQTLSSFTGSEIVAPSAVPCPLMKEMPRELAPGEIHDLVESFARAALRARTARFDAVEIHMAHGYLICQFLSPFSNLRTDEYGGTPAGRARFALEVLEAVKGRVGGDFPVICRISADEKVEGGLTLEESAPIAARLVEAGADAINVSACNYSTFHLNVPCYYLDEGCFLDLAGAIREAVDLPVIGVGRIWLPEQAEEALARGDADLVAMGRALIADPRLPEKARLGRSDAIRPCLACNRCFESMAAGGLACMVNPDLGPDRRAVVPEGSGPLRVVVVGGGPAGMEAACSARALGHDVSLFEAGPELGGQVAAASVPPGKAHFIRLVQYYIGRLEELGVRVVTSTHCTAKMIEREGPDRVIVATGAVGRVDGIDLDPGTEVLTYMEALSRPDGVGPWVVVIGGGPEGAEVADTFSAMGRKVTLLELRRKIGLGLPASVRMNLEERLERAGVEIMTRTRVLRAGSESIEIERRKKRSEIRGFDSVVLAIGRTRVGGLAEELEARGLSVHVIGDARKPRNILEAIAEGAAAAREI